LNSHHWYTAAPIA